MSYKKKYMFMRKLYSLLALALLALSLSAQGTSKNVLFIGNSYTEVNNLPMLVQQVAQSMGDQLTYQSNTPGGCTFMQHCSNQSMNLIQQGGWDVVVLQEQSQYPSFPDGQVQNEVFPYAAQLVQAVYANNPDGEAMFYMTWGRKYGDSQNAIYFPVLGTYEGMDSMLYERYMYMARTNDASVSPVGRVWRYLRTHNPDIELYQSDNSHPSLAGSYAAACCFYTMIFKRDPMNISFRSTLDEQTAATIRSAVHTVVFDNLSFWERQSQTQPQGVTVTMSDITATTATASFHMLEGCTSYTYLMSDEGGLDQWVNMMGVDIPQLVDMWGITQTTDFVQHYTASDLQPATNYIIYVNVHGTLDTMLQFPFTTLSQGSSDPSVITISVTVTSDTSALIVCTPNAATSMFIDLVMEREAFDRMGRDSAILVLKDYPYIQYETDTWEWLTLSRGTAYYALAMGQNGDGEWGDLAMMPFNTTAGILNPDLHFDISIYPNPSSGNTTLALNNVGQATITVTDLQGRTVASYQVEEGQESLSLSNLATGIYLVRVSTQQGSRMAKLVIK